jgi:hypothetical protein
VEENPIENLAVLYGTGVIKVTEKNEVLRTGGVKYTIKDGIVYDARKLLADVRKIVKDAKDKANRPVLYQPGLAPKAAASPPAKP